MGKKRRIISLLLCAALCAGLLPTTALAGDGNNPAPTTGDKTIMAGTSGIKDPTAAVGSNINGQTGTYYTPNSFIYFGMNGTTPIKWRVLSTSGNATESNDSLSDGINTVTNDKAMFLLSEYLLASDVYFQPRDTYHYDDGDRTYRKGATHQNGADEALANAWQESTAQTWAKDFAGESGSNVMDAFSTGERAALLETTKADGLFSKYDIDWGTSELKGDKVFFLSAKELARYVGDYDYAPGLKATPAGSESARVWWLRSPYDYTSDHAGVVYADGLVGITDVTDGWAVRPAFNLNLNSVLFTSAAEGGKSSMTSGLQQVTDYTDSSTKGWKVTLAESDKSIKGDDSGFTDGQSSPVEKLELTAGYTAPSLTVKHKSLTSIDSDYTNITAALTDSSGNILYYGSINADSSKTESEVTIPTGLTVGSYTLSVRGEDWNSDKQTDYATGDALTATIEVKLKEQSKPTATFMAASSDSGTLSGVDNNMKYGIGTSNTAPSVWTSISAATAEVSGLTGGSVIWIIKNGDDVTTADSEPQTIEVSKAATPTGLETEGCTNSSNNDGKIYGFASGTTYEYKKEGDEDYQEVSGTELTGLASGNYNIRVKAGGAVLASDSVPIVVSGYAEFAVSVVGSEAQNTGAGSYAQGAKVSINAGTKSGYTFAGWTSKDGVEFADAKSAQTTFTMLGKAVTVTATWTANSLSGGGYSAPTYSITLPKQTPGGKVTSSPRYAEQGDRVTLTATPDEGYKLDSLTVKDSRDNLIELTDRGEGKYTFTMPGRNVTVEAKFSKIEETPAPWRNPFADVSEGEWYYDAVKYVCQNGLMNGTSATTFSPGQTTSRAMIATILWRQAGSPAVNYAMRFDDVDPNAYYGEAVRWAASEGIVSGYGNGKFGPNDPITREQLAAMLYNYEKKQGGGFNGAWAFRLDFDDVASVSEWAYEPMSWMVMNGVISGTSSTTLSPKGQATRAQAATMLMRYLEAAGA